LLLVPVVTAHEWRNPDALMAVALGIAAFCLAASSTYVLNDYMDCAQDRQHPVKCNRPFASGNLKPGNAFWLIPLLALAAVAIGGFINAWFMQSLLAYLGLSWAYCLVLKNSIWLDALALASLYTFRVVAGAFAIQVEPSAWLLGFSVFLFFSLTAVKRLQEYSHPEWLDISRPYTAQDRPLVLAVGVAAGVASVLVLALYLNSDDMRILYHSPAWLWLLCPMLLYWLVRIWTLANRGTLNADPVLFALRDGVSWLLVLLGAASIFLAT